MNPIDIKNQLITFNEFGLSYLEGFFKTYFYILTFFAFFSASSDHLKILISKRNLQSVDI